MIDHFLDDKRSENARELCSDRQASAPLTLRALGYRRIPHVIDAPQSRFMRSRLVMEKGAQRAYSHGVAEQGVPFREIARIIGQRLNVPVVSLGSDEKAAHFGWFTHFAELDIRASNDQTRRLLGWEPSEQGLLADLEGPAYFAASRMAGTTGA